MLAALKELAEGTNVIAYMMAVIGILGVLAKIINQLTLHRLVKAAGNMPKSTHRLIKLVRAKYEHACMIHDSVENISAFVEKYIYEYRGFLFRIHTWSQIEMLCVWFAGILGALGASLNYLSSGFTEPVYQYIAGGLAEVVFLSVVMRLSDEPYKICAVKMYMEDYLDNICAFRLKKQRAAERESIDVISSDSSGKSIPQSAGTERNIEENTRSSKQTGVKRRAGGVLRNSVRSGTENRQEQLLRAEDQETAAEEAVKDSVFRQEPELPINIEGEPREAQKGDASRQAVRRAAGEKSEEEGNAALREETIRQILEEFLA